MAAVAAIEIACWDIVGKAAGHPIHALLGGQGPRPRPRLRQRLVPDRPRRPRPSPTRPGGRGARLHRDEVRSVRRRLAGPGPSRRGSLDRHRAGGPRRGRSRRRPHDRGATTASRASTALRLADRLAEFQPAWLEEPVHHSQLGSMVEVARRSPVPIATGESFTSLGQFADLLSHDVVHILQPEPLHLGGLWRTRQLASMAEAHLSVVAPHNAQGPVCGAIGNPSGRLHPELLRPGDVRRVQRRLDTVARRSAGPAGRRPRRGVGRAWSRDRTRLGGPRGPSVPAPAPHPPLQPRMGATATTPRPIPHERAGRRAVRQDRGAHAWSDAGRPHRGRAVGRESARATIRVVRAPGRVNLIGEHTDYNDGLRPARPPSTSRSGSRTCRPTTAGSSSTRLDDGERDGFDLEPAAPASRHVAGLRRGHGLGARRGRPAAEAACAASSPRPSRRTPGCRRRRRSSWPRPGRCSTTSATDGRPAHAGPHLPARRERLRRRPERADGPVRRGVRRRRLGGPARLPVARVAPGRRCPTTSRSSSSTPGRPATSTRSEYNLRRSQCEAAVAALAATTRPSPRCATSRRALSPRRATRMDPVAYRRAEHVVTENAAGRWRPSTALAAGDLAAVGRLFAASHASLRDRFEVVLARARCDGRDRARRCPGVVAARMTGAGFGGCTVNLVRPDAVEALRTAVERDYPARTGLTADGPARPGATAGAGRPRADARDPATHPPPPDRRSLGRARRVTSRGILAVTPRFARLRHPSRTERPIRLPTRSTGVLRSPPRPSRPSQPAARSPSTAGWIGDHRPALPRRRSAPSRALAVGRRCTARVAAGLPRRRPTLDHVVLPRSRSSTTGPARSSWPASATQARGRHVRGDPAGPRSTRRPRSRTRRSGRTPGFDPVAIISAGARLAPRQQPRRLDDHPAAGPRAPARRRPRPGPEPDGRAQAQGDHPVDPA